MQKYPFQINTKILNLTADISELVGKIDTVSKLNTSPQLRRQNRIKTIYSSLAIEQNTLSEEQVTAVLEGKRVLAPPKDIAEVENAYEIYEMLDEEAGEFRSRPVGVVDTKGNVLHVGTLPRYVPQLVEGLLDWVENDENNLLIKSCVFHYEFELIHPFSDGNGRVGRLWHTLLLSKWNPLFMWLPIESVIHDRQSEYYNAINTSNVAADSTAFIEFMLSAIKEAMIEAMNADVSPRKKTDKTTDREKTVLSYLSEHGVISNSDVRELLSVSPATANRILNTMADKGIITRFRNGKSWAYTLRKR